MMDPSDFVTFGLKMLRDDRTLLKLTLKNEGLTMQWFLDQAIQGYLRGDRQLLLWLKDQKEREKVSADRAARYELSQRDREKIYEDLEKKP